MSSAAVDRLWTLRTNWMETGRWHKHAFFVFFLLPLLLFFLLNIVCELTTNRTGASLNPSVIRQVYKIWSEGVEFSKYFLYLTFLDCFFTVTTGVKRACGPQASSQRCCNKSQWALIQRFKRQHIYSSFIYQQLSPLWTHRTGNESFKKTQSYRVIRDECVQTLDC